MNNADFGLTLQKIICDKYDIPINSWAYEQFTSSFNPDYVKDIEQIVPLIFERVGSIPSQLLTYTTELTKGVQTTSPHNFLLKNNKTMSIRTVKTSDKVAPRTVGQAGFPLLNEYFSTIYGGEIRDKNDIKILMINHIHEVLPIFIDCLFQSDLTVFVNKSDTNQIQVYDADEVGNYEFSREDFTFTKELGEWNESTTLKYHGISIAEIQTHKERSFKFRFIISRIPEWFNKIRITNETFGISAEAAICDAFNLQKPDSFKTRASRQMVERLLPVVKKAFSYLPLPVSHTGSTSGKRGKQSKCSYDFVLQGSQTLSLKTNTGKMVCPPEVGQPGAETCYLYFKQFLENDVGIINNDNFKTMVLSKIEQIMPIYVEHLFDSDWLMWIREEKGEYTHLEINKDDIQSIVWEKSKFSFTKPTIDEWNESNTVKYDGLTIGEFQVHKNRDCYKFRFQLENLLKLLKK